MNPPDFHHDRLGRGQKYTVTLETGLSSRTTDVTVLIARGHRPGKTLVVTAAVHGDEYEGVRAILEVWSAIDPMTMAGDLIAVPVANPPAFWQGTRASPLDGANLARVFPGDPVGSPSAALAYHLGHSVIARADLYVDLHSAGTRWSMPMLIGYNAADERSQAAALNFGASVLWGHPTTAPGRTVSFAESRGIPWLYTEAHGGGRIDSGDLLVYSRGVTNLMRHLEILKGEPDRAPVTHHLFGDGNLDVGIDSTARGFFVPNVELLQPVKKGDELGRLHSLDGNVLETYRAPGNGMVVLRRELPVVEPGELMFFLTGLLT